VRACAVVAVFVVAALASAASAEETLTKEVAEAVARGDRAAALARLDAALRAPRDRAQSAEAARAAMDVVKGPEGNLLAARILVAELKRNASDAEDVRFLASELRRRSKDADLPAHQELLRGLAEIYPEDEMSIDKELARSYRLSGRTAEARETYAHVAAAWPNDVHSRWQLAFLNAELGDLDAAEAVFDQLIAIGAAAGRPDVDANKSKIDFLLRVRRRLDAARKALEEGEAAVRAAPPSPERESALEAFAWYGRRIAADEKRRATLRDMRSRLNAALAWTAVAWAGLLGGGLVFLRRRNWI
jgi:hypothetical protein